MGLAPYTGRIAEVAAVCRDVPLKKPFAFASYTLRSLPYAWVRIRTTEGFTGYGECPTYWDPSGETQLAAVGAVHHLEPILNGHDASDIEGIFNAIDREARGAFAAKCGLDMALYDIAGQCLGIPVYRLLGGTSGVVRVNGIVPLIDDSGTNEERLRSALAGVEEQFAQGITRVKLKVGLDLKLETTIASEILRIGPPGTTVFVDANQAWSDAKTAIRAIRGLEKAGVDWIEQPVVAHDVAGLRRVRGAVDASIIADESLYSPVDALRLIKAEAVDMFNVKLAKCGGLRAGSELLAIARAANVPCLLGSMIESPLGMLANYHFGRAHQMVTCGLSVFAYTQGGPDVGFSIQEGQLVKEDPDRPGLGYRESATLDSAFN